MMCKNYYKMNIEDVIDSIEVIRDWLWQFNDVAKPEDILKARFALHVALNAQKILSEKDDFVNLVIDNLLV